MLGRIIEKESILIQMIEELKEAKLPLLLYGAGLAAKSIYAELNKHGIKIDYIAVDSSYHKNNMYLFGIKVLNIEDVLLLQNRFNVLISFCEQAEERKDFLKLNDKVNKVYIFDGLGINHFSLSYEQIIENLVDYLYLYNNLEDELSREVLIAFINSRISGKVGYMNGVMTKPQYFPEDIINITEQEVFVDCGAFDGDTILDFLKIADGKYKRIYAFEPDVNNYEKISNQFLECKDIKLINKGAWVEKDVLRFSANQGMGSYVSNVGDIEINVDSIDNITKDAKNVSFIKMDIEGSELEALKGAKQTIIKYKPKLAICVYHKVEDLLLIPKLIRSFVPEYKLYMRAHHYSSSEIVLYAIT